MTALAKKMNEFQFRQFIISHPQFAKRMFQGQGREAFSSPERAGKYMEVLLNICINMHSGQMLTWVKEDVEPESDILLSKCLSGHQTLVGCWYLRTEHSRSGKRAAATTGSLAQLLQDITFI